MPTPPLTDSQLQEAINLAELYGTGHAARKAGATQLAERTLDGRIARAILKGFRPTVKKDAPRIYERKRLAKMHIVIPDCQVKPGVNTDHLEHVGNYIAEKQPDVIVCIGDFWDMPSLCVYDKGKLSFEGRRYVDDVKAGQRAMERLLKPIHDKNRAATEQYRPRMVFTLGNHEHRVVCVADDNPEFAGKFSFDDLQIIEYGWELVDFLKPVEIDGILYAHYFTSGVRGNPVSSAAALLRDQHQSATMGHVQHTDIAMQKKTQQIGLFCGTCYTHDEQYLGYQGNCQRRQIIVKNEVEDGRYDPLFVSLKYLERAYS